MPNNLDAQKSLFERIRSETGQSEAALKRYLSRQGSNYSTHYPVTLAIVANNKGVASGKYRSSLTQHEQDQLRQILSNQKVSVVVPRVVTSTRKLKTSERTRVWLAENVVGIVSILVAIILFLLGIILKANT